MKKNDLFWVAFVVTSFSFGQSIFINEIHYDNIGVDSNEGVEIAGPAGTDLSGYEIRLYNGSDNETYSPIIYLLGTIPNQQNNMGTLWFPKTGIQNGSPDGLALIDNLNNVIQFLSYEGVITALNGPAVGLTSVDIGIFEDESTPNNYSLQLIGSGSDYTDFTWNGPMLATPGQPNTGQILPVVKNEIENFSMYPNPIKNGKLFISSPNRIDKKIEIFSMSGASVYKSKVQSKEVINISNLTSGIYMVKVEEEGRIATRKLIVK